MDIAGVKTFLNLRFLVILYPIISKNSTCYECETKIYCQFLRRGVL